MRSYYYYGIDPNAVYRAMLKRAAAVMTPEAMQAGQGGMPMDPSMMQGGGMPPQGAPMDPSMMQGGMPMDPSMMQGGGMPPQGAPMDPSMMQGGGQLPPEILQDQAFIAALQQAGIVIDPASGTAVDPSGQPIPAEMLMQAYEAFLQGQQQGQAQMAGAAPTGMQAAAPGAAPDAGVAGVPEEALNAISSVVVSSVEPALQDLASQLGQALSDMSAKIDAIAEKVGKTSTQEQDAEFALRSEIENDLLQQQVAPQQKSASVPRKSAPLNIFSLLNKTNK